MTDAHIARRTLLQLGATAAIGAIAAPHVARCADDTRMPTDFRIACMTLPYAAFSLSRALDGIAKAGFRYVAWGTTHIEPDGTKTPVMPADAAPDRAAQLAKRCRDLGLEPVMMFSMVYPEHDDAVAVLTNRIRQAHAAGVDHVLTFGHTRGGNRKLWVERFRQLGPIAADHNVTIVIKQHGGETGTGEACMGIVREVDHPNVWVNYDAGNVMDYLNLDPIADLAKCADYVRGFCIKDHRNWPKDQDCGPGFGEIDHYRLLAPVAWTGRAMPLCCENIFAPLVPRPTTPDAVDTLARRAREYLETVIAGLHA
ncbi:MAG: TIM barrel protein [Phycisphaera sp.]|nr:TIM barrel protein [Phycisphaera sp.]